jgi:hypothetical protein
MSESNETLSVAVHLRESDIQRANFWFQFSKWSTRLLFVLPLFGLFLLSQVQISKVIENPIMATPLVVLIVFPVLYPALIWFQTKRGFANLQDFQKKVQYNFSAEGYEVNDEKSSARVGWDAILRAVESRHSFHLFFHKSMFHTLPKRCITGPEDLARLRAILKGSLGSKAEVA